MLRNTRDINATTTSGSGELYALPKVTERAMPVVATAQLVVESRRVRQILLRYISPLYRWASIPSSAALNGLFGGSATLISLPPVNVRHEVGKGATARKVKNRRIGCQCHSDRIMPLASSAANQALPPPVPGEVPAVISRARVFASASCNTFFPAPRARSGLPPPFPPSMPV